MHGIKIQVGGGIRNKDSALSYLEDGIDRIILGTKAVTDPTLVQELCSLYPNRIILAVDFYKGKVKTKGWVEETSLTPQLIIKRFAKFPLASFIVTDISRDGMMKGPNIKAISQLSSMTSVPLIASGGIANLEDLKRLKKENNLNEAAKISGVICGRSLYKRSFTLEEAIKIIET